MPITLDDLKSRIDPRHTVLLLGAGASVPSGAPTGADLAKRLWKEVAKSEPQSEDLIETASILVRRYASASALEPDTLHFAVVSPPPISVGLRHQRGA
jgi:NAD-dependent SIR2 family protein deacetylase